MISKDHQLDRTILWILLALEALLFYTYYTREIAPYPPQNFDQAFYLSETYALEARVQTNGVGEFWQELRSGKHASSLALPVEGALFGVILGGARLPQLCLLFVAFAALQLFAVATVRKVWGHRAYGIMFLGLILSQGTLWYFAGGLFDFRIDFLAYSLYGIWVCAVIRSSFFFDRRWAIGCGLIGALLVLHRFLSVIYVTGVSTGFAVACAIIWFLSRNDVDTSRRMRQRLLNLGLSLGSFILVVFPILLINWTAIYNKYVYAQFIYEKDLRAREYGIVDLTGHLFYYPRSILWDHLGQSFLWASTIGLAGALVARLFGRSTSVAKPMVNHTREMFLLQIIFLVGAVLGPIVVLTIDISKSPVIGGIVGVPVALLLVSLFARIVPTANGQKPSATHKIVFAVSLAIFAIGLYHLLDQASRRAPEHALHRDLKRVAELDRWLVEYASEHGWPNPTVSVDVISGWFNAGAITASGYEQLGELIEFQPGLGNGNVMGVDRSQALSMLANSDFVLLTTLPKTGIYPFFHEISQYWDDLKAWTEKNMILVRTMAFDNFTATVYARPTATVSGLSGGWVTSRGLSIEAPHAALLRFRKIRLFGPANYSVLPKIPTVSAVIDTADGARTVPASLRHVQNDYEILIDTSSMELPPSDPVRLHVAFDTFFVPKKLGINEDTSELVFQAPSVIQLLRREP